MINRGITTHVNNYFVGFELPLRVRKLTGRDAAVINEVVVGTGFLDELSTESERSIGGQKDAIATQLHARSSDDVIKAPGFRGEVVSPVTGLNVVVIRSAVEADMASNGRFADIGIVGYFISAQNIIAVVNFRIAVQLVYIARFFLIDSANRGRIPVLSGSLQRAWGA